MRRQSEGGRWCEGGRGGTGSHRGPRVGGRGLRRECNGGRYPLAEGGGGVGRVCLGLQRPSLGDLRRCGGL